MNEINNKVKQKQTTNTKKNKLKEIFVMFTIVLSKLSGLMFKC